MMVHYFRLLIVFVLFAQTIVKAGTTGKIAGEVKDTKTGEPLIGANVLIEGTTLGAATNFEGYYVILNIRPGQYNVVVSAIGYNKQTITGVIVSVDLTTTINVQLEQTVLELGQEVVVIAERPVIQKDRTSSEARVNADQIKTLPVREVHEVLALQAGITTDRFGGIHIRGGRTSEVAYWVDGVSISDAYDGSQAVQVDNKSVQELQVISGTFNAEYGQAMSGIVNIVTKDGDQELRGSLSAYSGTYFTSDGGRNEGKEFILDGRSSPNYLGSGIFYNLDEVRPFDSRNIEASLSGPIPSISSLTFYASARYFKSNGWFYGNRVFHTDGSLDNSTVQVIPATSTNPTTLIIGDNPVAMNDRERITGQGKLTYQFTPSIRLSLSGLWSRIDYRDYSHDWRLVPGGDLKKFERGYNISALWTHTLSSTSFYTVNISYFEKKFKEHLFSNPLDTNYLVDPTLYQKPLFSYNFLGTNIHQFKRRTETRVAKIDYTDQVSKLHQVKAGVEAKLHQLYLEDYSVAPPKDQALGFIPTVPDRNGPLYQEYTEKPVELSAYLQDKLEYERMIVNIGIRLDYFNSRGSLPADPQDPNIFNPAKDGNRFDINGDGFKSDNEQVDDSVMAIKRTYWYKKASRKYSVSPRLGISYPITDRGALHFSYGHFLQIPSFQHLFQRPGYKVTTASGVQGVFGNPDLDPQKTVMYEFGLQQQLSDVLSFDITGFYRDTRDWVSTSVQIPVRDPATATTSYTIFTNRDYANSRGVTFTLDKRMQDMFLMNFSYTFLVAEGNNSNPDEEQAALVSNREPARILTPLDWDQRHTANLTIGFGKEDWGVFILGRYGSGLPYSPVINQAEARGEDAARALQKNSRRRPANYTVDLRLFKNFTVSEFATLSLFLKIFNLFDRRNEIDVYGQTGRAIATPQALGIGGVSGGNRVNTVEDYLMRPDFYSEPREIQFGLELSF